MQLIHETDLSVADYVSTKAWQDAKLERCPVHPDGGCRFARHGTYGRKTPSGLRVARYYCPEAGMTFSLLPQFMAAGMPGTLQSVEDCAAAFEAEGGLSAAGERVRPGRHCDPRAARRWVRRRVDCVRLLLAAVVGLFPDALSDLPLLIGAFRRHLGGECALIALRLLCADRLQALPSPVGFRRVPDGAGSQTGPPTQDGPCRRPRHAGSRMRTGTEHPNTEDHHHEDTG